MSGNDETNTGSVALSGWARSVLRCPVYGCELTDSVSPTGEPELLSSGGAQVLAYPVRNGIPVLIADDARVVAS